MLSSCVCPSVCLSVCLSVCRYCIKTAELRITQITPHDSSESLVSDKVWSGSSSGIWLSHAAWPSASEVMALHKFVYYYCYYGKPVTCRLDSMRPICACFRILNALPIARLTVSEHRRKLRGIRQQMLSTGHHPLLIRSTDRLQRLCLLKIPMSRFS